MHIGHVYLNGKLVGARIRIRLVNGNIFYGNAVARVFRINGSAETKLSVGFAELALNFIGAVPWRAKTDRVIEAFTGTFCTDNTCGFPPKAGIIARSTIRTMAGIWITTHRSGGCIICSRIIQRTATIPIACIGTSSDSSISLYWNTFIFWIGTGTRTRRIRRRAYTTICRTHIFRQIRSIRRRSPASAYNIIIQNTLVNRAYGRVCFRIGNIRPVAVLHNFKHNVLNRESNGIRRCAVGLIGAVHVHAQSQAVIGICIVGIWRRIRLVIFNQRGRLPRIVFFSDFAHIIQAFSYIHYTAFICSITSCGNLIGPPVAINIIDIGICRRRYIIHARGADFRRLGKRGRGEG